MTTKNVLLIGASGGLGNHIAQGLADAGYNLALNYNTHSERIEQLKKLLEPKKIKFKDYKADITIEDEIAKMAGDMLNDFGTIDILINDAGISIDGMSWKLGLNEWNKVINVNLTGPFLCIKHVLPHMRKNKWGRIVNISSVVPSLGIPGTAAYSASKAGLAGLTKTISKEVINLNITVNTISLGYFDAGMLYNINEEIREKIKDSIPRKEFGNPSEIVSLLHFLISDKSSYLTGQVLHINGGLY
jgi:NAD(P)-dependent dehydrogenase (short-subunit alcohol dehydrogenase family)